MSRSKSGVAVVIVFPFGLVIKTARIDQTLAPTGYAHIAQILQFYGYARRIQTLAGRGYALLSQTLFFCGHSPSPASCRLAAVAAVTQRLEVARLIRSAIALGYHMINVAVGGN